MFAHRLPAFRGVEAFDGFIKVPALLFRPLCAAAPEVDAVLNSTSVGKVKFQNAVRQYADVLNLRGEGSFIKTIGFKHLSADRTEPILPHA